MKSSPQPYHLVAFELARVRAMVNGTTLADPGR